MSHETRWPSSDITDIVLVGPDGEVAFEHTPMLTSTLAIICEHGITCETTVHELAHVLVSLMKLHKDSAAADAMEMYVLPKIVSS